MNVLSLFDGMSCGQLALQRAGIHVDNYFASEIDINPMLIAKQNFPATQLLGDVRQWKTWDLPKIDLILAGSPCQGFSKGFTGTSAPTGFDDARSALYFYFEEVLDHYKPKKFLLENVVMKDEWKNVITERLGVRPMLINSADFSAQRRKRLYWTDIEILPWEITEEVLIDVIEDSDLQPLSEKANAYMSRTVKGGRTHWDFGHHSDTRHPKSSTVVANFCKGVPYNVLLDWRFGDLPLSRHFSITECERLQTLPDGYTDVYNLKGKKLGKTHKLKAIGNGWTVDVIAHILKNM